MRTMIRSPRALFGLALFGAFFVFMPGIAHASTAGGGLPWDTVLVTLENDITGPVAFGISLLAMVACGAALIFGGEINEFIRRMIMLVLVAAFLVTVTNFASALGITGAVV